MIAPGSPVSGSSARARAAPRSSPGTRSTARSLRGVEVHGEGSSGGPSPPGRAPPCRPGPRPRARWSRRAPAPRPSPSRRRRARTRCRGSCTTLVLRRAHLRVARDARARRLHVRLGPLHLRERVEPAQRVQQRPRRRQRGVEPLQDRGALDLHPDPVGAVLDRERAEDPDHAEPGARDQDRPEQAVERRRSRAGRGPPADRVLRTPRTARRARRPRSARRAGRRRARTATAPRRAGPAGRSGCRSTRRARDRSARAPPR